MHARQEKRRPDDGPGRAEPPHEQGEQPRSDPGPQDVLEPERRGRGPEEPDVEAERDQCRGPILGRRPEVRRSERRAERLGSPDQRRVQDDRAVIEREEVGQRADVQDEVDGDRGEEEGGGAGRSRPRTGGSAHQRDHEPRIARRRVA